MSFRTKQNLNVEARVEGDAVRVIEYAHVAVHDDSLVLASSYDEDVDDTQAWYIIAPEGLELHLVVGVSCSEESTVSIYRNPTITDAGTAVTHFRPNLHSTKAATNTVFIAPTIEVDGEGTLLWTGFISAGRGGGAIGGETRNGQEIILPSGESLYVLVTVVTANEKVSLIAEYYEVPNGATNNE